MLNEHDRERIRRGYYVEKKSIHLLAREEGCNRATIRKALANDSQPFKPIVRPRPSPIFGPYKERCQGRRTGSCNFLVNRWQIAENLLHFLHQMRGEVAKECQQHHYFHCLSGLKSFLSTRKKTTWKSLSSQSASVVSAQAALGLHGLSIAITGGIRWNCLAQGVE